jgi:pyruvate ferredoxin oxidoreductase alpha subunit
MEIRRQADEAMHRSVEVIEDAYQDFRKTFNRGDPSPFIEEYMTDDAEIVIVGMGTLALPVRVAIRRLREAGRKIGFVRIKFFRPFATEEIRKVLAGRKAVCVIDRDYSFGSPSFAGVLFHELRSALYPLENRPMILNFIAGLGGREVHVSDVNHMIDIVQKAVDTGEIEQESTWIGVRE